MIFYVNTARNFCSIFLFVMVLVLFGCGSGENNKSLIVLSVTPENGSIEQNLHPTISVVFSNSIDPSSLSDSSFKVSESGIELLGVISYEANLKTATFTPSVDLPLNVSISVSITEEVHDLAGNHLSQNYDWTFFTRDGVWNEESILDTSAWWSNEPKVTWVPGGGAVATWFHYGVTIRDVFSSHYSPQSGWDAGVELNADGYGSQVATGAGGDVALIVRQGSGGSVIYNNWFNSETEQWSPGVTLDSDLYLYTDDDPQISIFPNGDAIAVWEKSEGLYSPNIYASHYDSITGLWGGEVLIENGLMGARYPKAAASADGDAITVWQQSEKVGNIFIDSIYANRYDSSTDQWGSEVALETSDNKANYPDVAIDKDGNAIAVWRQQDGPTSSSTYHLCANYFDFQSGSWSGPTLLQEGNINVNSQQIAFDKSGSATVIWMDYSSTESIYAIRFDVESKQWEMPVLLASGNAETRHPRFSYDYQGNAMAVWHQRVGSEFHVFASRFSGITKQWGDNVQLSTTEGYNPDISLDQFGHATVVWSYGNGSTGTIYARRFE